MPKIFGLFLTLSTILSLSSISSAMEVDIGGYVQVTDNKLFQSPFVNGSYLLVKKAELIENNLVAITFELSLTAEDVKALMLLKIIDPVKLTNPPSFTATYPESTESLESIKGLTTLKSSTKKLRATPH